MTTYVAMIRGINLGGRKRVAMGDLEALFTALGHADVTTYIQSGNVVFDSPATDGSELAAAIEERIARDLGHQVTAVIRTRDEMAEVVAGNPFTARGADPAALHVTFLAAEPDREAVGRLEVPDRGDDEFEVAGREVYLYCPQGYGRTKLDNAFWERRLKVPATTRNWRTVDKLVELANR